MDDIRQRILDAAFIEFSAKGRAGARMKAIADGAGVNKALLNYYFSSKDQLYYGVMQSKMSEFAERLWPQLRTIATPREFVRAYIQLHTAILDENPHWIKFLLHFFIDEDAELFRMFHTTGFHTEMLARIQLFIDAGHLRERDPYQVMLHLMALVVHPFLFKPVLAKLCPPQALRDFADNRARAALDLVENGLFA